MPNAESSSWNRIKALEKELKDLKEVERRRIEYSRNEKIAAEFPYRLSNDGKPEPVTPDSLGRGAWEFGYDEFGFPAFGYDYGNGGVSALAARAADLPNAQKLAMFHQALSDFKYLIAHDSRASSQDPLERQEQIRKRLANLVEKARDYGWEV